MYEFIKPELDQKQSTILFDSDYVPYHYTGLSDHDVKMLFQNLTKCNSLMSMHEGCVQVVLMNYLCSNPNGDVHNVSFDLARAFPRN